MITSEQYFRKRRIVFRVPRQEQALNFPLHRVIGSASTVWRVHRVAKNRRPVPVSVFLSGPYHADPSRIRASSLQQSACRREPIRLSAHRKRKNPRRGKAIIPSSERLLSFPFER